MKIMKFDLLIHCGLLVTPTSTGWFEKSNQIIGVRKNLIELITDAPKNWRSKIKSKKCLDLSGHLVLPGLINAHTHLAMTLFRGLAEDMEFHEWLNDYIFPIERELVNNDFVKVGTQLAAAECIRQGVTCVNDMYYFTDVVLEVLDQAGLRGFVAQTFMDYPTPDNKNLDDSDYRIITKSVKKYKSHPRLKPAVGPHAPYTCGDEVLIKARRFANENNIPLHIHVSETAKEVADSFQQYKKSPVKRLYDLGIMDGATSFAHAIHLKDEDFKLIKNKSCGLIHNPESNMKINAGVCPVPKILKEGIALGLGTDGAASNNNLNMIEEMDVGIKLQKSYGNSSVTSRDFLRMATLGSAQALGLEKLVGSLELGKRADLIALDLDQPHMMPLHDPIAQVVCAANGGEVTHTICDGRVLMADKKLLTMNLKTISSNVRKYQNKIQKFLKLRSPSQRS